MVLDSMVAPSVAVLFSLSIFPPFLPLPESLPSRWLGDPHIGYGALLGNQRWRLHHNCEISSTGSEARRLYGILFWSIPATRRARATFNRLPVGASVNILSTVS